MLGEIFGEGLIVGERHRHMHFIGLGAPIGRLEIGERSPWSCGEIRE